MSTTVETPNEAELKAMLGSAFTLWSGLVGAAEEACAPINQVWKPSKSAFGRICLLQYRKRTLLYLTPDQEEVWVAIILGDRAYGLAMASSLPAATKRMLSEARPYAEGRGIRFPVSSMSDIPVVAKLVEIKTTGPDKVAT